MNVLCYSDISLHDAGGVPPTDSFYLSPISDILLLHILYYILLLHVCI